MQRIVGVTGGIGAGKSVVCHVLSALGLPVFDCDAEAKRLMDSDDDMKRRIADEVTPLALNPDGSLCRKAISDVVFTDGAKLEVLNMIVHGAVRSRFVAWKNAQQAQTVVVETAILYESGFDRLVNEVCEVTAPIELRVERVMRRSNLSRQDVMRRIASQGSGSHRQGNIIIVNDNKTPLISQILNLLDINR